MRERVGIKRRGVIIGYRDFRRLQKHDLRRARRGAGAERLGIPHVSGCPDQDAQVWATELCQRLPRNCECRSAVVWAIPQTNATANAILGLYLYQLSCLWPPVVWRWVSCEYIRIMCEYVHIVRMIGTPYPVPRVYSRTRPRVRTHHRPHSTEK